MSVYTLYSTSFSPTHLISTKYDQEVSLSGAGAFGKPRDKFLSSDGRNIVSLSLSFFFSFLLPKNCPKLKSIERPSSFGRTEKKFIYRFGSFPSRSDDGVGIMRARINDERDGINLSVTAREIRTDVRPEVR